MSSTSQILASYPALDRIVKRLNSYLRRRHPDYFGSSAEHPCSGLKSYKVIHDNLWGTNRFSWRELAIIDSPIFQRLREIHQTGLAYQTYPCAHHTRFEHSLGVATIASRAFDALAQRHARDFQTIANELGVKLPDFSTTLREELRMAALLHDLGHSMFSHASEHVYSELPLVRSAVRELRTFVGAKKGAGEVLSFCLSRTSAIRELLTRAQSLLPDKDRAQVLDIDLENVSLLIVGRSKHPYLQFMGDIISSDLDSDKLDYLLRDANAAGLPLRYDLERYLYSIAIVPDILPDGDGYLEGLYRRVGTAVKREEPTPAVPDPYFNTYRLRLPREAMNTIEQIVICKFMLFSYIYHHRKVRSAEGLLAAMLTKLTERWAAAGQKDEQILEKFLDLTDSSLHGELLSRRVDGQTRDYALRIHRRLLPREVYGFVASRHSHAEGSLLSTFIKVLRGGKGLPQDRRLRDETLKKFHNIMGAELRRIEPSLGKTASEALWNAGAWLDAPRPPKFENINLLIGTSKDAVPLSDIFPIHYWIQAYESHRYAVRVFCFSEHLPAVRAAARIACEQVMKVTTDSFYDKAERKRV